MDLAQLLGRVTRHDPFRLELTAWRNGHSTRPRASASFHGSVPWQIDASVPIIAGEVLILPTLGIAAVPQRPSWRENVTNMVAHILYGKQLSSSRGTKAPAWPPCHV